MKKVLLTATALGCLTAAGTALGGIPAGTGVNGSLHDMTVVVGPQADKMGRVCVFCHTPHHAQVTDGSAQLPLWNHKITPADEFTPYTWATPTNSNDGAFDITDPLAGPSRLCMSCHDGSIAIDEHGDAFKEAGSTFIGSYGNTDDGKGRANLTKDLSNTHPIGFDYNAIAAFRNAKAEHVSTSASNGDSEIVSSSNGYASDIILSQSQGTYNDVKRTTVKKIADNLYGGNIMTCATCHEVHNKENMSQKPYTDGPHKTGLTDSKYGPLTQDAPNYFLYSQQDRSLICLSCHVK